MTRAAAVTLTSVAAALVLSSCDRAPEVTDLPKEPYKMVYTLANTGEVTMLDLNSVTTADGVSETWSLVVLSEPTKLDRAPESASLYWMRARIDCNVGVGQFTRAIGLKDGQPLFDLDMTTPPTPLQATWQIDEIFICQEPPEYRVAATTFAEALTAANEVMNPEPEAAAAGAGVQAPSTTAPATTTGAAPAAPVPEKAPG